MGIFRELETFATGQSLPLTTVLDELPWNTDGLLPAIAQQFDTGEVLMLAWMNRESLAETLPKRTRMLLVALAPIAVAQRASLPARCRCSRSCV